MADDTRETLQFQLGVSVEIETGVRYRLELEPADSSDADHRLAVRLLDWSGAEAISGVDVDIELPNGKRQTVTTDGDGKFELPSPAGVCLLNVADGQWPQHAPAILDPDLFISVRVARGDAS
jgi:hypothetical protein